MWLLRLILILLGAAFIAGVYYYTRRHPPRNRGERKQRREPTFRIDAPQQPVTRRQELPPHHAQAPAEALSGRTETQSEPARRRVHDGPPALPEVENSEPVEESQEGRSTTQVVFSLALRLPEAGVDAGRVVHELERLGLSIDERHIYCQAGDDGSAVFNVANLFEPGVLDPLPPETSLRGLSFFFMAEPSPATGGRFDRMLGAAYECARALGGRLEDMRHRPLTAARELELKLAAVGARSD